MFVFLEQGVFRAVVWLGNLDDGQLFIFTAGGRVQFPLTCMGFSVIELRGT